MPRSKSPAAARKSSSSGNDAHIQAAISFAVLLLAIAASQKFNLQNVDPRTGSWIEFFQGNGENIHETYWNYSVLTTLHALNVAQSASGGFWLNSAIGNYFATFAPLIVLRLFFTSPTYATDKETGSVSGGFSIATSVFNKEDVALAGTCWFIVNNAIGGMNIWDEIKKATNGALDSVLELATLAFTLEAAFSLEAPAAITDLTSLSTVILAATCSAIIANGANFFPLNKGISFDGFDDVANRAFTTVCIVAALSSVEGLGEKTAPFAEFFGKDSETSPEKWNSAGVLVLANVLHSLITGAGVCPAIPDPVALVQDKLYEVTGLSRE